MPVHQQLDFRYPTFKQRFGISVPVWLIEGQERTANCVADHDAVCNVVALLRACAKNKDLCTGEKVHDDILKKRLLRNNLYVANALVTMYAKCGALAKAQEVLDDLPIRDAISWSALIAGYAREGRHAEEALNCFEHMQCEGHSPDAVSFACALKACGSKGALNVGKQIHAEVAVRGLLQGDVVLGSSLVDMYVKCGALAKAQEVLHDLPVRDVVTWSTLIAGYARDEVHAKETLNCYKQMCCEGHSPDAFTFACMLKVCGSIGALDMGEQIHAEVDRQRLLQGDVVLGNIIVDMYAKCRALDKAQEVFDSFRVCDTGTWLALIAGYAQEREHVEQALNCYKQMQCRGYFPDATIFASILKACGNGQMLQKGKEIHTEVSQLAITQENVVLGGALVDMYVKCGALVEAQQAFDNLSVQDVVTLSTLIAGYAREEGYAEEAVHSCKKMQHEGCFPDAVTFTCAFKACANVGALSTGKQFHVEAASQGFIKGNIVLGSALVDMYVKCGALAEAQKVLESLSVRNVVIWSALIAGYAQEEKHGKEALNCYERMQAEGHSPDAATFLCILKACGNIGAFDIGKQIHVEVVHKGLLQENILLGNAIVDMYVACGALATAREVLEGLPVRDVITWSALLAGYAREEEHAEKALICFEQMQSDGHVPDAVSFLFTLKACGNSGALDKGKEIHDEIMRQELLNKNFVLGSALVDMYAKCGVVARARAVLEDLPVRKASTWSALVAGYAQHGYSEEASNCLEEMQHDGFSPDAVTLLSVLNACSHSGLVEQGEMLFEKMSSSYGIKPSIEHHACMIDLFSRAGHFDKAIEVITKMPFCDSSVLWATLLGACRKWGHATLGRWVFDHEIVLDKQNTAAYVCMCNIYAAAGMEEEASKIEACE